MINATMVFKVKLSKIGGDKTVHKFYVTGNNILEAGVNAIEYINLALEFDYTVQIKSIKKVKGISKIVSVDIFENNQVPSPDGYSPIYFLEMSNKMPEDEVIRFKCECKTEIKVANIDFPFINCPNCLAQIKGTDIKEAGGFYYLDRKSSDNN